jgi:hypothetical protein
VFGFLGGVDRPVYHLGGDGVLWEKRKKVIPTESYNDDDYVETRKTFEQYILPVDERMGKIAADNFVEVERGFSRDQIIEEARHCLHCDRASLSCLNNDDEI